jgi:hypothetical protein
MASFASLRAAPEVDYNRDVRPILSENCFACHGFDPSSREADLRLDLEEAAVADRGGYSAIVPGDLEASEAWRRIASEDDSERMPPPDSHRELSSGQKDLLRRWIAAGAPYARHWSFVAPAKASLPDVGDASWAHNAVDRFVLARLEQEELAPSPEADRRTLIRRLSFDLTGLPPSADEVAEFVADADPEAYEKVVDRLLASPHFGERMALAWLDLARYADTNGFSIDGGRHMWLWRDWVINAFNRNLPYDQFLLEQLAGDLLPNPTQSQLIATGFQRNNMVTHEGGTIPEENLVNYNADRVKTFGEAVLGLTLGCAQCHDHKYDPITQRDYYSLFAYFNTVSDIGLDGNGGVNAAPSIMARTVLPTTEVPEIARQIADARQRLEDVDQDAVDQWADQQRKRLAQRGRGFATHTARPLKVSTPNTGEGFGIEGERFVVSKAQGMLAYDVSLALPECDEPLTGLRIVFHPDDCAPGGGLGFGGVESQGADAKEASKRGEFILTAVSASAELIPSDQINLHRLIPVRQVTADSWRGKHRPVTVLDPRDDGWAPRRGNAKPARITLTFAEPIYAATTPFLTVQVNFGAGGSQVAARFEFQAITGVDDDSDLDPAIIPVIQSPRDRLGKAEQSRLRRYFARYSDEMRPARVELANLEDRMRTLTEEFPTMVMADSASPRKTYILNRGNYADPLEQVTPGTPAALPPAPAGSPPNRLGLAQWLTMSDHPLTSRVAVNHAFQLLFGAGLVRTPADFGAQGEWPTHRELLDWLAADFVASGWDFKRLVRLLATSAAYRQSSIADADLLARDPDNRLLARGPRFRLPAELIRDAALKTSGLLVNRIGGPSVNPYAPGDLWREVSHYGSSPATAQTFVQDHGEKLYRRSLYTYWKRTAPPPNMSAFDAPNREICAVERSATNTPLQALVLLNDVQFVEAGRALAERMLEHGEDDRQRLRWAFEECLSRPPNGRELDVITAALERERRHYAANPDSAAVYLTHGESPRDEQIPAAEHAAWSQVATLIMNLSEAVVRN